MAKYNLQQAFVSLQNVSKSYGDTLVVRGIDLEVQEGEFVVLVGPSGCGKSTTLRMIAGLEDLSDGNLFIASHQMNHVPPKDRDVAMVFQNYALYPHMTVYKNMAFGLKLRKYPTDDIDIRVREAADILGLSDYLNRRPKALSGGERQRVALGRAIVRKPNVFLFDEPLSNLDAKLRVHMRTEIKKLHRRLATTMIYVTHDQVEAMTMGDRVVVMDRGSIQQIGPPVEIYKRPVTKFVAEFIGSPPMNFFPITINTGTEIVLQGDFFQTKVRGVLTTALTSTQDGKFWLGIRPENIRITAENTGIKATVEVNELLGNESNLHMRAGDNTIVVRSTESDLPPVGSRVNLSFDMDRLHIFDQADDKRIN